MWYWVTAVDKNGNVVFTKRALEREADKLYRLWRSNPHAYNVTKLLELRWG